MTTNTDGREINADFIAYNAKQDPGDKEVCDRLLREISASFTEEAASCKIWHGSPVWFLDGNPIVGYHKLKGCIRLLFWSGQSFDEPGLAPEGTFKAAEKRYTVVDQVDSLDLARWLGKSKAIQWDYKNIRKLRGNLVLIEPNEVP